MRSFKTAVITLTIAATFTLTACGGSTTTDSKHDLASVAEIQEIVDTPPADLVVLDIRTPEEFASGHLANAINIDYYADDFESKLAELDLAVPYVMYCNSGNRSSNALPVMDSIGFAEVYELDGGIQAWYNAGLTVEQ